jgi:hypothetical protein
LLKILECLYSLFFFFFLMRRVRLINCDVCDVCDVIIAYKVLPTKNYFLSNYFYISEVLRVFYNGKTSAY